MSPLLLDFRHAEAEAPLRQVAGLSLIQRAVLAAEGAGFRTIQVIVHEGLIGTVATQVGQRVDIFPQTSTWESLLDEGGADEVVVGLGDRVWAPSLLAEATEPLGPGQQARQYVPSDGTASPGLLRVKSSLLRRLPPLGLDAVRSLRVAGERSGVRLVPTDQHQAVHNAADVRRAETLLLRNLVKPADGVIARHINRKISLAITRRLARFEVRPNHITTIVLLLGLAAAPLAWLGSYTGLVLGALCYYLSAVLDGVDGELSRLKYLGSRFGAWFDTVTDDVVGLAWLVGMYGGLARSSSGWHQTGWTWVGALAVICYTGTILLRYGMLRRLGSGNHQVLAAQTRSEPSSKLGRALLAIKETIARTDFLPFYALVVSAIGIVPAFALPYALGTVIALIDTLVTFGTVVKGSLAETDATTETSM